MNTEKKVKLWFNLFILTLAIVYTLSSLGYTEFTKWIAVIFGFFLSGFLIIKAGVVTYFKKKEYKKITFSDVMVWLSIAFAVGVFINTMLMTNFLGNYPPQWLITFAQTTGVTVGVGSGLLAITHMISGSLSK